MLTTFNYVDVYKAQGFLAAEIIRLYLESAGIDAKVAQESAGLAIGLTVGPLGLAKVLVRADQADEAVLLINEMESQPYNELGEDSGEEG